MTTVYSIITVAAIGTLFLLALPVILAVVAVLAIAGAIAYWRLKARLRKMRDDYTAAPNSREDIEDVDFEVVEGEESK